MCLVLSYYICDNLLYSNGKLMQKSLIYVSTKAAGDLRSGIRGDGWSTSSFLSYSEFTFRPKASNPNSSTGGGGLSSSSPGTEGIS